MSGARIFAYGLVALVLVTFFVWVLVQMADADDSMWRLVKLGAGLAAATVGAVVVYALLWPTRRR
jgi:hypothetical protein